MKETMSKCGSLVVLVYLTHWTGAANSTPSGTRLNEYIHHYEPLHYATEEVAASHLRVKEYFSKRLPGAVEPEILVNFTAHHRNFTLKLKRDTDTFGAILKLYLDEMETKELDTSHIYTGVLEGEPESVVFGSIRDGVFEGKIITPNETFYVERSHKYPLSRTNNSIHSVIYSEHHVTDPYHMRRSGTHEDVMQWMLQIQNSHHLPTSENKEFVSPRSFGRTRRAARTQHQGLTCTLSIQTDPFVWKHISDMEGTTDEYKIRREILSLVAQHVKAANFIFSRTLFPGKDTYNVRFQVQRIQIDTNKSCGDDFRGDKNELCNSNVTLSDILNEHSRKDHEVFCLAYLFTFRHFTPGTLGLAWQASSSGASGGICEKFKTYTEAENGTYQSSRMSLNTGVITLGNYNHRLPPKVSQLSFAHQLGHSFGSPHDYPAKCRPGESTGNFLMAAAATIGDQPNHPKFSDCSIRNISNVLDRLGVDRPNCLITTDRTFCGNEIVEDGEECDCGFTYVECEESCCYPRQISEEDRRLNPAAVGCTRKPAATCSPSEGPCCNSNCGYINSTKKQRCKPETECSYDATCNGSSARCPVASPKAELSVCNNGTQVCQRGECGMSICVQFGLQECFLSSTDIMDKRKLCEVACIDSMGKCRPSSELNVEGIPVGLSLQAGAPCDHFQGYCNDFGDCQTIIWEGP